MDDKLCIMPDVWVVVPAFNEAKVLGDTLGKLKEAFRHVVVVDDHSSDDTFSIAKACSVAVCRHPINLGQGAALQTGIDYALSRGARYIVTFDADGQHAAADAVRMVSHLATAADCDVVLASRFTGTTHGMSLGRRLLVRMAVLFTRLTTGLSLSDTHNGLRVLSRPAAQKIRLRQNRMAHASELLHQLAEHRLRYTEHPATVLYTTYSRSKGQGVAGAVHILVDLLAGRMSR